MKQADSDFLLPMDAQFESPSADKTPRHVTDQEIRARGYKIKSRPKKGEAIWVRNDIEFTQSQVLRRHKFTQPLAA